MKRAIALFFCMAVSAHAQMREVDGKIYNLKPLLDWASACLHDPNWRTTSTYPPSPMPGWQCIPYAPVPGVGYNASVYQVLDQGLVLKIESFDAISFSSGGSALEFLTNYPGASNVVDGQRLQFMAKKIGVFHYGGSTIPAFDCGKPWSRPPPAPQEVKAAQEAVAHAGAEKKTQNQAKVLRYYTELAATGDPLAELRLGEIYRDGEGVPKDMAKAREWLGKAAAHGDKQAAAELSNLR